MYIYIYYQKIAMNKEHNIHRHYKYMIILMNITMNCSDPLCTECRTYDVTLFIFLDSHLAVPTYSNMHFKYTRLCAQNTAQETKDTCYPPWSTSFPLWLHSGKDSTTFLFWKWELREKDLSLAPIMTQLSFLMDTGEKCFQVGRHYIYLVR